MSSETTRLVLQTFRHVAADDPLGQAFDDGRLADTGLADQHGVVLGAARQHLDDAADLLVAADHRIELALRGELASGRGRSVSSASYVASGFCVVTRWLPRTSWSAFISRSRVRPNSLKSSPVAPRVVGHGEQQVLDRDEIVLQALGFVLGRRSTRRFRRPVT